MKSGNSYTLFDLFSEDRKIIIPDLQRDYCWGNKQHDLVSSFVDNLKEADWQKELMLGLIYGYEHPKNHIQLCDGQQRLTTLFLLLGMLNKQCSTKPFSHKLISDFELNDDKEPYLLYAIRESTLYFLSDLVNEFFLKGKDNVEAIIQKDWYFKDYTQDPSIESMLNALTTIEDKIKDIDKKEDFGNFILKNLKFLYYDMQNRQNGEETFVIINTTGEPLTATENLKPILIGNIEDSEKREQESKLWEERETWFWQNRKPNEQEADNGLKDLITWYLRIRGKQEEIGEINQTVKGNIEKDSLDFLENLEKTFYSVKELIELLENNKIQEQFKFVNGNKEVKGILDIRNLDKDCNRNIVLPLLFFITKINSEWDEVYLFLRRLRKNYFDNILEERKGNYVDWRYILQIIENSKSVQDVLMFSSLDSKITPITKVTLNQWYNVEEQLKTVLNQHKYRLENWEDDKDFMGDLSFLFKTAKLGLSSTTIPELHINDNFNIAELKRIFNNYQKTIGLLRNSEDAKKEPKLTNLFRLFRIFIECNKVGHIRRASRDFEGVLFSTLNRNHLNKNEFMNLLNSNDLKDYCEKFVKEKIKEQMIFDLSEFKVDKFIKGWLTLKVFHANQENELLSFYDGNETGVAAYREKDKNKLMKDEIFDWGNSICGYGVRSGFGGGNNVHYRGEGHWLKQYALGTPFSNISLRETDRTLEEIKENRKTITDIRTLIET